MLSLFPSPPYTAQPSSQQEPGNSRRPAKRSYAQAGNHEQEDHSSDVRGNKAESQPSLPPSDQRRFADAMEHMQRQAGMDRLKAKNRPMATAPAGDEPASNLNGATDDAGKSPSQEDFDELALAIIQALPNEIQNEIQNDHINAIVEDQNKSDNSPIKRPKTQNMPEATVSTGYATASNLNAATDDVEPIASEGDMRELELAMQGMDPEFCNSCINTTAEDLSGGELLFCLLYTSPSPRDRQKSRMPSSA